MNSEVMRSEPFSQRTRPEEPARRSRTKAQSSDHRLMRGGGYGVDTHAAGRHRTFERSDDSTFLPNQDIPTRPVIKPTRLLVANDDEWEMMASLCGYQV